MLSDRDALLRADIAARLAGGLETRTEPLIEDGRQFGELLAELRDLPSADLEAKLVMAGFTDHPYGEDRMRCQECMYYLVHRKWCDLPELALPVEPEWWCRLWRI